jgi:glycosyltransferase involved in cell wall biosynthesis
VDGERVAAVVPALDEAARITATVTALRSIPEVREVIVVDDGSRDETFRLAADAGARAFRIPRRVGKGGALSFGAARTDASVLLFVDAELTTTAAETRNLLEPVLDGTADLAIAAPPRPSGPSGFGLLEGSARWAIRRLTGRSMDRPLSGQRAVRREVLAAIPALADGFGVEVAMTVDALAAGFRVVEVACEIEHGRTARTPAGFAHRGRQAAQVAAALLPRALRGRRS